MGESGGRGGEEKPARRVGKEERRGEWGERRAGKSGERGGGGGGEEDKPARRVREKQVEERGERREREGGGRGEGGKKEAAEEREM